MSALEGFEPIAAPPLVAKAKWRGYAEVFAEFLATGNDWMAKDVGSDEAAKRFTAALRRAVKERGVEGVVVLKRGTLVILGRADAEGGAR